ncbi:unnamed protein product [marine sediment metagenome]|uniref:eRF1 domain-containing protein n=1 Tax=marine sediment metagenome TaxID=412755 RepID=X1MFS3_9ZZZZ
MGERPDMATRGEVDTKNALKYGAVETLFLSKKINAKLSKELVNMAKNTGSNVEIISTETPEGEQFYNLSRIGAILRFRV